MVRHTLTVRQNTVFFDEHLQKPATYRTPYHNPLTVAFVRPSTGFLIGDNHSYSEWLSYRGEFNWMGASWDKMTKIYEYWPNLEDITGAKAPVVDGYKPAVVYVISKVSKNTITPVGVTVSSRSLGVWFADSLHKIRPDLGISKYNLSFVPLELLIQSEEENRSPLYWWWDTLRTFDWESIPAAMVSMCYWLDYYRELLSHSMTKLNDKSSKRHKRAKRKPNKARRRNNLGNLEAHTGKKKLIENNMYIPTLPKEELTLKDYKYLYGITSTKNVYQDPLVSDMFMRQVLGNLGFDISPDHLHRLIAYGEPIPGYQEESSRIRDILESYPKSVLDRLKSGLQKSLDLRQAPGDIVNDERDYTSAGSRFLSYQKLRQPRPQSCGYTRKAS